MPLKPTNLSSIAISSSRTTTITTTRAVKAKAKARAASTAASKASTPQPTPATSTVSQHFARILSLWPSDPLRPANLSFTEYIKARAALARSNNHLNYDNVSPTTISSKPTTLTSSFSSSSSSSSPTSSTTATATTTSPYSTDSPLSNNNLLSADAVQTHATPDGKAEAQAHNHGGPGHGIRSIRDNLSVLSAESLGPKGTAREAEAATEAAETTGTGGARAADPAARVGDSSARATIEAATATAPATAATAAEPTRVTEVEVKAEAEAEAGVDTAPVLKDVNALYTLLDDRYAKKFQLSTATIHPASNPNHYDALVAELEEAPKLSWFQKTLRKFGGMVRFK